MNYSKQVWYCNCCGKQGLSVLSRVMGRDWRVCGEKCLKEMRLRDAHSVLGTEYTPWSDQMDTQVPL